MPPAIHRIEQLVAAGHRDTARAVADSVLADTDPQQPAYPEALYWRGTLRDAPNARLDLLRLLVEYPGHPRVSDALYALARQEQAAGNREAATMRLEQVVRDFSGSEIGPTAAAELGRIRLSEGRMADGCAALDSALAHIPAESVEQRNQVAYTARPCQPWREAQADSAARRSAAAASHEDPTGSSRAGARDSASHATTKGGPTAKTHETLRGDRGRTPPARPAVPAGRWSVQVAAFTTKPEAEQLAAHLSKLGYDARVAMTGPFRVRVGHYRDRVAANAEADKLKAAKFTTIIVEAERP